jgi:hypothetical protein
MSASSSAEEVDQKSNYGQRRLLPIDYQLHEYDVFCGKGSMYFNHVGNHHFREIVSFNLQRYNNLTCRYAKSKTLHDVVDYIRSTSTGAGFVTKDRETGRYYEVGDKYAVSCVCSKNASIPL